MCHCWCRNVGASTSSALGIHELAAQLSGLLEDESAVTVRHAMSALKLCVPSLSHSYHSSLAIKLLLAAIQLGQNSYWLVKVSTGTIIIFKIIIDKMLFLLI